MKLTLYIDMDNAAFEDAPGLEAVRILREVADELETIGTGYGSWPLIDINGNKVGELKLEGGRQ
jgi:hypothetical protein